MNLATGAWSKSGHSYGRLGERSNDARGEIDGLPRKQMIATEATDALADGEATSA